MFDEFEQQRRFREAWNAVELVRPVQTSLFTFGNSVLPYYLLCPMSESLRPVSMRQGEVRIDRPMIITPGSEHPDFEDFFGDTEEEGVVEFLLARTAQFKNLKFKNQQSTEKLIEDPLEEVIAGLNKKLDDEEDEQVAILAAPPSLAGVALVRYAAERIWQSAPDNVQELRERGFLP